MSRVYLLHHSVGLPPRPVRDAAVAEFTAPWDDDPAHAWDAWLDQIDGFRHAVGRLLGVASSGVVPQSNVSSGLSKLLGSIPFDHGRRTVVMAERSFPSIGFAVERLGFDVRHVPADTPLQEVANWDRLLGTDVAAVVVTHALSNTGELVPPAPIAAAARAAGALTIVDVAQSAGIVPCDVGTWDVDAVVGTSVKWLCGGPGGGFLHVAPELLERCRPRDVGWFSHADPFEFDIHHFVDAPDARRFWGGTPTVAPFAIARRTIEHLLDVGIGAARAHNAGLVERVITAVNAVDERFVRNPTDPELRSGTAVIALGEREGPVLELLARSGVDADRRAPGIRLSPHLSTTVADVERAVDVLLDAL